MIKLILEDLQKIKSTPKQLREFGVVMDIFFLALAALLFFKQRHWLVPAGIGTAFLVMGFAFPQALLPLQKIWMAIAVVLGFFMSRIILSVLFFLVLTPLSLFSRLTGKKFLNEHQGDTQSSFWVEHPKRVDKKSYENQY